MQSTTDTSRMRRARWVLLAAYVGVIYATVPAAPRIWLQLGELTGLRLETLALVILAGTATLVSVPLLLRPRWRLILTAGVLALAYTAIYRLPFATAAERLHLLEYGIVPALVAWALGGARPLRGRLLVGAMAGAAAGVGDEIIQGLAPGRFFQFADIALNAASAGLGAIASGVVASASTRRRRDVLESSR